jgi:hypothetical protein
MPGDEAMFDPTREGGLVDIQTRRGFLLGQHSPLSQSIVAGTQFVFVSEIGNPFGGEAGIVAPSARSLARAISLLVEEFGDLGNRQHDLTKRYLIHVTCP